MLRTRSSLASKASRLLAGRHTVIELWFAQGPAGELSCFNVLSAVGKEISREEYNVVLTNFYQQFIRPAADDSGVVAVLGKDQLELEDLMSPHAAELLHAFSVLANRSVLHPLDDGRLENFIIAAHDEGAKFDATMLKRWLCEEEK
jgi:hypothetical protein